MPWYPVAITDDSPDAKDGNRTILEGIQYGWYYSMVGGGGNARSGEGTGQGRVPVYNANTETTKHVDAVPTTSDRVAEAGLKQSISSFVNGWSEEHRVGKEGDRQVRDKG